MLERIETFLNCNESLQRKIKIFIEYFVRYYGEDKRKEIEECLSKVIYIGYMTPDARRKAMNRFSREESSLLQDVVVEKTNLPVTKEDLFKTYGFESLSIFPIQRLYDLKKEHEKGKKVRLREFIDDGYEFTKSYYKDLTKFKFLLLKSSDQIPRDLPKLVRDNIDFYINKNNSESAYHKLFEQALPLLKKINPNVTLDNLDEVLKSKDVEVLLESYMEALQQYQLFKQEYKEHFTAQEKNDELERLLSEKYYIQYIQENIDLIPKSERGPIYEYVEGKTKNFFHNKYISTVLGYNLKASSILEYFDDECDLALKYESNSWKAKNIKSNRIQYFKLIGIDLGDDYEAYASNLECQEKWPTNETIEKLVASRNKFLNKFNNDLFSSIDEYKKIRETIDSKDLLDKDDNFNAKLLTDSGTFISPNLRITDEGYDVFSLFIISFSNLDIDYLDHNIVHELNHLYELMLSWINGNKYEMLVGWDYASGTIDSYRSQEVDTINTERPKRDYELFNEIINELIAQEICEMMHEDGVTVFDEPGKSCYKRTTSYEDYLVLATDFFHEYKDKIIESRRNGNIEVIFNEVGKENFDELNNLIKEYNENFGGLKKLTLYSALKNNEDNEMTRLYYDILERWKVVMSNMKTYSQEHKTK